MLALGTPVPAQIYDRWVQAPSGREYRLDSTPTNVAGALARARALGGTLATVRAPVDQEFVWQIVLGRNVGCWIGLSDQWIANHFEWHGREPVTYTNWAAGQPNPANDDVAISPAAAGAWETVAAAALRLPLVERTPTHRWVQWAQNRHWYTLTPPMSWRDADAEARRLGGHLVAISDTNELVWIEQTLLGTGFLAPPAQVDQLWIGLNDAATEGTWAWSNGEPVALTNWADGEPNNHQGNEDYVHLDGSRLGRPFGSLRRLGGWNDNTGNEQFRGIVETTDPCIPHRMPQAPMASLPMAFSTGLDSAWDAPFYFRCGGFELRAPARPGATAHRNAPNFAALLTQIENRQLDIDAMSLGLDQVLVDGDGHVLDLTNTNWAGLLLSVGQNAGRILDPIRCGGSAASGNNRSDVFGVLFATSVQPSETTGRPHLVFDDSELSAPAYVGLDVDGVDAYMALAYTPVAGFGELFVNPITFYFSVTHASRVNIPLAWVGGSERDRNGAQVFQSTWVPPQGVLPGFWTAVSRFRDAYAFGLDPLAPADDVDALAYDSAQNKVLFSTRNPARNQILYIDLNGDAGAPVPLRQERRVGGRTMTEAMDLIGTDEVDAICALDPVIGRNWIGGGRTLFAFPPCGSPYAAWPIPRGRTLEAAAYYDCTGRLRVLGWGAPRDGFVLLRIGGPTNPANPCEGALPIDFSVIPRPSLPQDLGNSVSFEFPVPGYLFDSGTAIDFAWVGLSFAGELSRSFPIRVRL